MKLLTLEEVAKALRVEPDTVDRLIEAEQLHAIDLGPGLRRVEERDLRTFIRVRRIGFRPRVATT